MHVLPALRDSDFSVATRRLAATWTLLLGSSLGIAAERAPLEVGDLRCELLVNPVGIAQRAPRLSWTVRDPRRGAAPSAYRVCVASSPSELDRGKPDLWDSGKVSSGAPLAVRYAGKRLGSDQACYWRIRVWDHEDRPSSWSRTASWTTGLLEPADWSAQWIGDATAVPSDSPAHNGFHGARVSDPDEGSWVAVDLGRARRVDGIRLHGARPYDRIPPDAPGYLFPLRFRVETTADGSGDAFRVVVDSTDRDVVNPGAQERTERFPAELARRVRLTVTRLAQCDVDAYAYALAELEVLDGNDVVSRGASVESSGCLEEGGWSAAGLVDGDVLPHPAGPAVASPPPLLRSAFQLVSPIRRATAFVTALGLYELRINGTRVGDRALAPEWTDYHDRVLYQAYDVTGLLRPGENACGVLLADGWYAGRIGMAHVFGRGLRAVYGRKPRLLLQLEMVSEDGSRSRLVTDGAWRGTLEGPLRSSDLYDGETVDLTREPAGWDRPGFRDDGWRPVEVDPTVRVALVAQAHEPIRVCQELTPASVRELGGGRHRIDFGQNLTGWVRLRVPPGQRGAVELRHAERLGDDGSLYLAGLRGALQRDRFLTDALPAGAWLEPRFTLHGFRYVEIEGVEGPLGVDDLRGQVVHSDLRRTAFLECSDSRWNRLFDALLWTDRANLVGLPLDCSARDERLPWVIPDLCPAELLLHDLRAFGARYLDELRHAQSKDGGFPAMAPNVLRMPAGIPGWGEAAGVWMPWSYYVLYGDRDVLARHYPSARRWGEFLRREYPDRICRTPTFGDWLHGDTVILDGWPNGGAGMPHAAIATAFCAHSAHVLSKSAEALGIPEDARAFGELYDQFRSAFVDAFVDPDGVIQGDTQAGYALALDFDLLPESLRGRALAHLREAIEDRERRLSTGNHATHRLLLQLSRAGMHDLACDLVMNPRCPSFGYMLDHGATSLWERWDSYVAERSRPGPRERWQAVHPWETYVAEGPFQDPGMNAYNHRGFMAVGEWLLRCVLGLEPDESRPGFAHFTVRPRIPSRLEWVRGAYDSVRGRIEVSWKRTGARLELRVGVPPGTTATVVVPGLDPTAIREGDALATESPGVTLVGRRGDGVAFQVVSGSYRFVSAYREM